MLASGVEGDTTAVFSDVFADEDAPDMLMRSWYTHQRLCSATVRAATYKLFEVGWGVNH